MPVNRWNYKIDIKQFFNDAFDGEEFEKTKAGVIGELKRLPHWDDPDESALKGLVEELECASDLEDFNYVLDDLYDWADAHRVWLGL